MTGTEIAQAVIAIEQQRDYARALVWALVKQSGGEIVLPPDVIIASDKNAMDIEFDSHADGSLTVKTKEPKSKIHIVGAHEV